MPGRLDLLDELITGLSELTALVSSTPDIESSLHDVAELTSRMLPGRPTAAVALRRDGGAVTVASAGPHARLIDEFQQRQGLAVIREAVNTSRAVDIPDLTVERRWGEYPARMLAHGIRSVHAQPLVVNETAMGALNVYGVRAHEFDQRTLQAISLTAAHAAVVLAAANNAVHQAEFVEHSERLVRHLFDAGLRLDRLRREYGREAPIPVEVRAADDAVFADLDTVIRDAGLAMLALAKAQLPAWVATRSWHSAR
ncbi:GAF domain-containing protein [Nocardia sp. NPDC051570]|uniref:GAF domain-containing protein n=1 Tax=Nocardia sp. NPDC051570 TaxID=3364324 RepID=UPI0037B26BAA